MRLHMCSMYVYVAHENIRTLLGTVYAYTSRSTQKRCKHKNADQRLTPINEERSRNPVTYNNIKERYTCFM